MPKKQVLPAAFFCLLSLAFLVNYFTSGIKNHPSYYKYLKYQKGDSLQWANPFYRDNHWKTGPPLPAAENWWVRVPLKTVFKDRNGNQAGLAISIQGSYQVYWDGHLIGENGKWGTNRQTEVEGKRINFFILADSLVKDSVHLLALRVSSFHDRERNIYPHFITGNYFGLVRGELKFSIFLHILAGIFLVIAVFYFFLYFFSYRYLPYFFFGLLCLCFFTMIMMEYMRSYWLYPYSFHFRRLTIIGGMAMLIGNVLSLFVLFRFQFKKKWVFLFILNLFMGIAWIVRNGYDDKTKAVSLIAFTFVLFICLTAITKKRKGSVETFYGVLACLSCYINYDLMLYTGFSLFVLFMLVSLSRQMKEQSKMHQESLLRAKRLEIELLKKNIQPHFLLNSLTSLMEWVERSPKRSIDFIAALAEEFELLNKVSGKQLIPVILEAELCRSHLKIMSFRKDIHYQLQITPTHTNERIPPAVFLTILENGITHNIIRGHHAVFTLDYRFENQNKVYTLFSPGIVQNPGKEIKKGTGLTYIETRLEESFPQKWELSSAAVPDGWETRIIIYI